MAGCEVRRLFLPISSHISNVIVNYVNFFRFSGSASFILFIFVPRIKSKFKFKKDNNEEDYSIYGSCNRLHCRICSKAAHHF